MKNVYTKLLTAAVSLCVLLSSCTAGQAHPSVKVSGVEATKEASAVQTAEPKASSFILDVDGIADVFKLKDSKIFAKLGCDYTTDPDFPAVYTYEKLGIRLTEKLLGYYGSYQNVYCIEALGGFEFKGTKNGMDFAEIMEKLGTTDIKTTWYLCPGNTVYEISYDYNNFSAVYRSDKITGENAQLVFWSSVFRQYEPGEIKISLPKGFKPGDTVTSAGVTLGDVIFFLHDNPWDLFRHMGSGYELKELSAGSDSFGDSLLAYKVLGISLFINNFGNGFEYDPGLTSLGYVAFDDICLKGADKDMSLDKIEKRLGKGERSQHDSDGEVPVVYTLTYHLGDVDLGFYAYDEYSGYIGCYASIHTDEDE